MIREYERLNTAVKSELTPEPPEGQSWRFADGRVTPNGEWCICVREIHHNLKDHHIEPDNQLVAIKTDETMEMNELVVGADFYAFCLQLMRILAWIQWNHPSMPWWEQSCGLVILRMAKSRKVKGLLEVAMKRQPEWSPARISSI